MKESIRKEAMDKSDEVMESFHQWLNANVAPLSVAQMAILHFRIACVSLALAVAQIRGNSKDKKSAIRAEKEVWETVLPISKKILGNAEKAGLYKDVH